MSDASNAARTAVKGTKESDRVRRQGNTHFMGSSGEGALEGRIGALRLSVLALAIALFAIALMPSGALARTTRLYEGSFPTAGPARTGAVAVDQSNGDIYVVSGPGNTQGAKEDRVMRFDSTGAPKNFTAGPNAGTNTLTDIGAAGDIAIDNSGGALNGSIYVVEANDPIRVIRVFASNGESSGVITGSGTLDGPFYRPTGIAVDRSDGSLYVYNFDFPHGGTSRIWRYAPKSPTGPIDDSDYTVTGASVPLVDDLEVVAGVIYFSDEKDVVQKMPTSVFAPSAPQVEPTILQSEGAPVRAVTLAVDQKNGDLYVGDQNRVSVFGSSGTLLYRFGASVYFGQQSHGLAVKSAESGPATKVYVAEGRAAGDVAVFGLPTTAVVRTHPLVTAFGKGGTPGSSFGKFALGSLAFDRAARRLYALDVDAPGIYGFESSAPPGYSSVDGFTPLTTVGTGQASGLAVDNTGLGSAARIYLTSSTSLLYGFDPTGTPLGGGFPIDPTTSPGGANGSPADLRGTAVDSMGNVWVVNRATKRILQYSSTGAYLSSVDISGKGEPQWIAFDSNDDMYVSVESGQSGVWKYTAPGYGSATQVVHSFSERVTAIAVDPSTGDLYVASGARIDEYDSAGNFLDEFAIGIPGAAWGGLAVDPTNHYLYAADQPNGSVYVFGPGAVLPDLALAPVSALADTSATLNGSVGPQMVALSDCHFEYVTVSAFQTHRLLRSELGRQRALRLGPD